MMKYELSISIFCRAFMNIIRGFFCICSGDYVILGLASVYMLCYMYCFVFG
jgi:hypothetical protein